MSSPFSAEVKQALGATRIFAVSMSCIIAVVYIFSGIVVLKPNEAGVHLRFGRVIHRQLPPGMHFVFPWPVDTLIKVPLNEVRTIDLALFYPDDMNPLPASEEPHLLSGDKNLVQILLSIQVTITDPSLYLFSTISSDKIAHHVLASALVETAASTPVNDLLTIGRVALQKSLSQKAQKSFDDLHLGLHIRGIEVKDIAPPRSVLPNFKEVVNAQMQKNTKRHQAESRTSSLLFRAKSLARKKVEEANGEYQEKVSKAVGETERFNSLLEEYKKNPYSFRRRMYLETIGELLPKFREVIIVDSEKGQKAPQIRLAISE
jgi:membrane protease subunit HflK